MDRSDPLIAAAGRALEAATRYVQEVGAGVRAECLQDGQIDAVALDSRQIEAHGLAWMEAYLAILRATLEWARSLDATGAFGRLPSLALEIGFGEYLAQLGSGVAMAQDEVFRPSQHGLGEAGALDASPDARRLMAGSHAARRELVALLHQAGPAALVELSDGEDETARLIRAQFRAFADARIAPCAPDWHARDSLIPIELVRELAGLGVFGLTTPETFGGSGMGAAAMCVVTEELSRGYLGVGSLGTRSEIASELIRLGGTEAQKRRWLPLLASGEVLPAAAFTEPNTGSDLARVSTRAERSGDTYRITGNKTWITHAARADLLMLLARTGRPESGHLGLTMFLAEKQRATTEDDFPAFGLSGSGIGVLGYRGMREYELAFDGFEVPAANVLGGVEGQGFRQLMSTFELARIQTAARALGVAQSAFELGFRYASERIQFGRPLIEFPRVFGKLAWMVVEQTMLRQLVKSVARLKETGTRCDVEAGMAKLVSARAAWSAADNALQIHGGNGYALESPISRVLVDARILSIFEGTAEIQANIIARGLMSRTAAAATS